MTREVINVGVVSNDGLGDKLRVGWQKANDNFLELYTAWSTLDGRVDALEAGGGGGGGGPLYDAPIAALQAADTVHSSQITALQTTTATHTTQIAALDGRIDVLEAGGGDTLVGAQILDLQAADTVHSSQISARDGRIDVLEAGGGDTVVGAQILALQDADMLHGSQISSLQSTTSSHTTQIAALQAADTVHSAQITSLQNADTLHGSQIAALQASSGGGSSLWGGTAGGTANAITLTPSPALGSYTAGYMVRFLTGASANTGAVTLAISGLSAVAVNGGKGTTPLKAGALPPGTLVTVVYDGTRFRLLPSDGTVNVADFGALGDGTTDDTAAIQAALTALGSAGGTAYVPNTFKCLIDNNLTIPTNCHLVGPHSFVGTPGNNASAPYGNVAGTLLLNSAKTITVNSGASICGLLIYRKGMTFPAANSSAFAGTAITIGGDDAAVASCMILGFNKGIYSSGFQRPKCEYVMLDNINGIEITNCADIAYISNCHAWPFSNISVGGSYTNITRSGKAFYVHDLCDWAKLTNCFSWGYVTGFQVTSANSVTLIGCGADNATDGSPLNAGSIGFRIDYNSTDTTLIGCQAAANATAGVYVSTAAGVQTKITDMTIWGGGTSTVGVFVNSGDVRINGGNIRGQNNGVQIANTGSRVLVDNVRFESITNKPIIANSVTSLVFVGPGCDYTSFTGSPVINTSAQTIASADPLVLPNTGEIFTVTGNVSIGTIGHGWAGRRVTLVFTGNLTLYSSTGSVNSVRCYADSTRGMTPGETLHMIHNGTQWYAVL